jgi:hypothetical protein
VRVPASSYVAPFTPALDRGMDAVTVLRVHLKHKNPDFTPTNDYTFDILVGVDEDQ